LEIPDKLPPSTPEAEAAFLEMLTAAMLAPINDDDEPSAWTCGYKP
jgi:hypothetical protein